MKKKNRSFHIHIGIFITSFIDVLINNIFKITHHVPGFWFFSVYAYSFHGDRPGMTFKVTFDSYANYTNRKMFLKKVTRIVSSGYIYIYVYIFNDIYIQPAATLTISGKLCCRIISAFCWPAPLSFDNVQSRWLI